jgi:hypothetical protein
MRRVLLFWSGAFILVLLGFIATVILLNATVYSASGFVRGYLDSLARQDSATALEVPGVRTANNADTALLTDKAMGSLDNIERVSDVTAPDGIRTIVFGYSLDGGDGGQTTFLVESTGVRFGLFTTWRFVASPLTTMSVTVLHDSSFTVNALSISSPRNPGEPHSFVVFSPGRYTLGHTSTFLTAEPVTVNSTTIGEIVDATIDVQANDEFVAKVQSDLDDFLDRCATQQVLMPTGCPFGLELRNRIEGLPTWSITSYPVASIIPRADPTTGSAAWNVPDASGVARITVNVRSIFDGSVSARDEDVPFSVGYSVELRAGAMIVLTPRS